MATPIVDPSPQPATDNLDAEVSDIVREVLATECFCRAALRWSKTPAQEATGNEAQR